MSSYKTSVVFYVWDIGQKEEDLIGRIALALLDETNKIVNDSKTLSWKLFDGLRHDDIWLGDHLILAFGTEAIDACHEYDEVIELPPLQDIMSGELKTEAWKTLKVVANLIAEGERPVQTFVEKDNVSVGIGAQIEITEQEAGYLKKIRDLLGGGKMVITKGDLRIEVGE